MKITTCKRCAARIFFGRKAGSSKLIPFDATPVDAGGWVVEVRAVRIAPIMRKFAPLFDGSLDRYAPHWATCPNADEFRGAT